MDYRDFLRSLLDKTIDHLVSVIIAAIFTTSFVLEIFTRIKPVTRIIVPFLQWRWSGWLVLVVALLAYLVWRQVEKIQNVRQVAIQKPPKYYASHDRRVEEREFAGVAWRIVVGSDADSSKNQLSREDVSAWPFPHAYCLECDYELERKRTKWYCMPCKKYYKIPRELRENTWEKIRRNYQRLVVQWGYNNFGIGGDNHKPLRVVIREAEKRKKKDQQ